MKHEVVQELTETFEGHAHHSESGTEFWLARDLQHLLGYSEWRNFSAVVNKAKTACEVSGHAIADHFVDVNKMVELGIQPEALPPAEDIKKTERRVQAEDRKSLGKPTGLDT